MESLGVLLGNPFLVMQCEGNSVGLILCCSAPCTNSLQSVLNSTHWFGSIVIFFELTLHRCKWLNKILDCEESPLWAESEFFSSYIGLEKDKYEIHHLYERCYSNLNSTSALKVQSFFAEWATGLSCICCVMTLRKVSWWNFASLHNVKFSYSFFSSSAHCPHW